MNKKPWRSVESEVLADGPVKIVHERLKTPEGDILDYYYQPRKTQVVFVLPLTENGTVLMIEQYRHPTGGFLLEIPAGKVEKGEDLASAARRELLEETGARAGELVPLPSFYPQPSFNAAIFNPFLAFNVTVVSEQQLESGELLKVVELPLPEVYRLLARGEIRDASSALTLHYAKAELARRGLSVD